ncbi:MAG: acyl-CoA dehydrogenase family protein [Steroidobacteraceae bacterium]
MIEASEEQRMIRDTAARLVAEATAAGPPAQRDMDAATWAIAVESGWSALPLAEDDGGLGGGAVELGILAEELGRGLLLGDWLLGSVLCARLVAAAPGSPTRAALLARIAAGERSIALADGEPASRGAGDAVRLQARVDGDGWTLTGAKRGAWVRDGTRELLVTARASRDSLGGAPMDRSTAAGGPADRSRDAGVLIAVVPRSAPGLALREYDTVDAGRALDLEFDGVRVPAAALLGGRRPRLPPRAPRPGTRCCSRAPRSAWA